MELSRKLRSGDNGFLIFWCPGCDTAHRVKIGEGIGPCWEWNGNLDRPTFSPSILVQYHHWVPSAEDGAVMEKIRSGEIVQKKVDRVCHSFVSDGRIQFLSDSTHHLAGRTVDMPDFDSSSRK